MDKEPQKTMADRIREESFLRRLHFSRDPGTCADALAELAKALKKLPQEQRDIVIMRYYDGYSLTEISDMLHISYGMTKVKHKSALDTLRNILSPDLVP